VVHLGLRSAFASFEHSKSFSAQDIQQFMCRIFIARTATAALLGREHAYLRALYTLILCSLIIHTGARRATGNICI
jgi:hypothetical protein